jgi:hypothetical protein
MLKALDMSGNTILEARLEDETLIIHPSDHGFERTVTNIMDEYDSVLRKLAQ